MQMNLIGGETIKMRRREHNQYKRQRNGEKMKAKLTFNFYLNILPHHRRLLHSSTSSLSLLSCLHPSVFVLLLSCRLLTFPTFSSLQALPNLTTQVHLSFSAFFVLHRFWISAFLKHVRHSRNSSGISTL